ncbi:unnamed protein product [Sphenostylis stenocarpa]|uniref:Acyl-CoA-binding domain-containing protein n=1 Tax=Sphenostylis stenocarpa TaxID=92480 RepID=A0AA86W1J9_9FABA|nr:unnamed protein product [Sphenostylis stenocarpa]
MRSPLIMTKGCGSLCICDKKGVGGRGLRRRSSIFSAFNFPFILRFLLFPIFASHHSILHAIPYLSCFLPSLLGLTLCLSSSDALLPSNLLLFRLCFLNPFFNFHSPPPTFSLSLNTLLLQNIYLLIHLLIIEPLQISRYDDVSIKISDGGSRSATVRSPPTPPHQVTAFRDLPTSLVTDDLKKVLRGLKEYWRDMEVNNWHTDLTYDDWVPITVSGARPSARYKHAAAVVDERLYIAGGSRNGRHLYDVQVFDLRSLTWSSLKLKANVGIEDGDNSREFLPATSGHNMIRWGEKLLLLGGIRYIDIGTCQFGVIKTSGNVPVARVGQSATLVGSRVILFGGEDMNRKLLNDVHVLDLDSMTWEMIETTQTPPAPRFDHAASIQGERYLLIFGGCSHSVFFNDLHLLDMQTMEWSQPQTQGDLVSPRAGHAGVTIDESWFIVGGGDNKSGCPETLVLDMSKLVWTVLTVVKQKDPLSSEGLSVCSTTIDGENYLLAFGGYNGRYSNELFVMRPKAKDILRPKIFQSPAAAAAAASVTSAYALSKSEKLDFMQLDDINFKSSVNGHHKEDVTDKIEAIKEEKRVLELSIAEVRAEHSKLGSEIEEINNTHAELSKELQSVQGQLVAERSRCFNLEAKIAELQKLLESMQSVEDEVQALREKKSALDQEMELVATAQRQSSGGVWRWFGGSETREI